MIRLKGKYMKKAILSFDEQKNKFTPFQILSGLSFLFLFIAIGLAVCLFFRPVYYTHMESRGLAEKTGYSEEEIRLNYDALIDWCSPFNREKLSFPTLPSSESAISHFEEAKVLFNLFFILGTAGLIGAVASIIVYRRKKNFKYLLVSAITVVVLPLAVGIFALIDFDAFFVLFHKLAFNNDDWIFNPATDPIIRLLPESFFEKCALIIVGTVILGAAVLFICYITRRKSTPEPDLLPKKRNYIY